jgi:hypothetical protein
VERAMLRHNSLVWVIDPARQSLRTFFTEITSGQNRGDQSRPKIGRDGCQA